MLRSSAAQAKVESRKSKQENTIANVNIAQSLVLQSKIAKHGRTITNLVVDIIQTSMKKDQITRSQYAIVARVQGKSSKRRDSCRTESRFLKNNSVIDVSNVLARILKCEDRRIRSDEEFELAVFDKFTQVSQSYSLIEARYRIPWTLGRDK